MHQVISNYCFSQMQSLFVTQLSNSHQKLKPKSEFSPNANSRSPELGSLSLYNSSCMYGHQRLQWFQNGSLAYAQETVTPSSTRHTNFKFLTLNILQFKQQKANSLETGHKELHVLELATFKSSTATIATIDQGL